jgi:hypothetical protein
MILRQIYPQYFKHKIKEKYMKQNQSALMDLESEQIADGDDDKDPRAVYGKQIDEAFSNLRVDPKQRSYISVRKDKFLQDVK